METFLLVILLLVGIIFIKISIDLSSTNGGETMRMKTEYETPIKYLKSTLLITLSAAITIPLIVLTSSNSTTAFTVITYMGTIFGSILSVTGAILAVLMTFNNQKVQKESEERASKKLLLNTLYHKFHNYYINNTLLGMSTKRLTDDSLLYFYARDFLSFHSAVYKELTEIGEEIADNFYTEFEEELEACTWVLNFEKLHSKKFMASLLNKHAIFRDEMAEDVLKNSMLNNEEAWNERYEYSDYEVFLILERHISTKSLSFASMIKSYLKSL